MALVSMRAYARHRAELGLIGGTHRAVQKAVGAGRILKGADGLIDTDAADKAWAENTSEGHRRNPAIEAAAAAKASPGPAPAPSDGPVSTPVVPRAATVEGVTLQRANAMEKGYRAKIAQLDFEERSGKLVNADEVKLKWSQIVAVSRNKILGLPSKIKNQIPDLTVPQVQTIELLVAEALEDLANGES